MTDKRLLIHAVFLLLAPIIAAWFGLSVFAASLDLLSNISGQGDDAAGQGSQQPAATVVATAVTMADARGRRGEGGGLPGSGRLCLRAVQV